MKNNIRHFSHRVDSYSHRKFLILRAHYGGAAGWAMEARFWALNCLIGDAEGCRIDLKEKGQKAKIAHDLELSMAELEEFLIVLKEESDLLSEDENGIFTPQTQEDLSRAMAARGEAKNRRNKKIIRPSGDEFKTSADESKTSGDEFHGGEGKGVEGNRTGEESSPERNLRRGEEEDAGAREAPAPALDIPDQNREAGLYAIALEIAMERKAARPETFARKIMHDDDVIARFKAKAKTRRAPKPEPIPAPRPCTCGGVINTPLPDRGKCSKCGKIWEYDVRFGNWYPDQAEAEKENTG